jgi:hypothetical protein
MMRAEALSFRPGDPNQGTGGYFGDRDYVNIAASGQAKAGLCIPRAPDDWFTERDGVGGVY